MTVEIRRVVTGVNADGKAVVIQDGLAPKTNSRPAISVEGAVIWITDETPADLSKYNDPTLRDEIGVAPAAGGSLIRVVDFLPPTGEIDNEVFLKEMGLSKEHGGAHAFMHRTKSIDYAIILQGEIDMLLDEGEVHLKAGDILVQRGTTHAWVNRGDKPCRIAFVLIDAKDFPPPNGKPFPQPG
jgi:mannose-6-phosphate isomerase-like protein (cupin superfamily)